jgi:YXWGXW repeat-containing protein
MKKLTTLVLVVAAVGSLAFLTACPPPPHGRVYVRLGPPVPAVEVVGAVPGPEFVWIPGHHRWDGNGYVWVEGRWERRPRPGAAWVQGHWNHDRHGWYWVEGHWR